ncbi:hypothetical protein C8R44DRAFT_199096 [Mycena epipterygia]|nr:hypothetical protein C8R44DRAFT_199096 [Mycena epipterygia]
MDSRFVKTQLTSVRKGFHAFIGMFWMKTSFDTPRLLEYIRPLFEPLLGEARTVWLKHHAQYFTKSSATKNKNRRTADHQFLINVRAVQNSKQNSAEPQTLDSSMASTSSGSAMVVDSPTPALAYCRSPSPAEFPLDEPILGLNAAGLRVVANKLNATLLPQANPSPGLPIRRHSTVDFATPDLSPSAFRPLFLPTLDAAPFVPLPPSGRLEFLESRRFSDWPSPPPSAQGPLQATVPLLPPFSHTSNPPGRENGLDAGTHSRVTSPSPDTRRDRPLTPLNGRTPEAGSPKKDKRPTSGKDSV